jgi:hypothetical protein
MGLVAYGIGELIGARSSSERVFRSMSIIIR